MPKTSLKVVGASDTEQPDVKNVKDAADHSERALLVALRTGIATDIDAGVPPAYLAPLARQIREIDREIRTLDTRLEQEAAEDAEVEDETFDAEAL